MAIDTGDDDSLLKVLYEKYRRLMMKVAMDVLSDSYAAEDAVHEAFIKVAQRTDMIRDVDSNQTKRLLITVTKNAAIDIYRKKKLQTSRETAVDSYDECADAVTYIQTDADNEILDILKGLPAIYRDVFLLKYSSQYENSEIASILEISENTVRQRIARGKTLVEKALKETTWKAYAEAERKGRSTVNG